MFKSVEFRGFEGLPELKKKAEQLTSVLGSQIDHMSHELQVVWNADPTNFTEALTLNLSLILPNGISGSTACTFGAKDLAEEWRIRSRCRDVWADLLGELIQKQDERLKEYLYESAEV
jgi:hypothetical protein